MLTLCSKKEKMRAKNVLANLLNPLIKLGFWLLCCIPGSFLAYCFWLLKDGSFSPHSLW